MLLFLLPALANECSEPVEVFEVIEQLDRAEQAYADLDELGFRDHANTLTGILLPCVADPLPTSVIHRQHRVMGLQLSMVGDTIGAARAMRSARAVEPDSPLPEALVPSTHPLREAYELPLGGTRTRKVPKPRAGSLTFDGLNTRARPRSRPTIVQHFDGRGESLSTRYLAPGDPLPPYRAVPQNRNRLIAGAAGAGIGALGTYVSAYALKRSMLRGAKNPAVTQQALLNRGEAANALSITSGVLLTTAIAAGIGALAIGER